MTRHVVARVDEVPPGGRKRVVVNGRAVAIFNLGGEFHGLADRCPHQGASLCEGRLIGLVEAAEPGRYAWSRMGEIVRCPWHGWEFDIRTGRSRCEPERIKARHVEVETAQGSALAEGPYVAETVAVAVEAEYLVINA